ncbi:MAG: SDR family NAD(P)-dependent oxidoreductase [Deltaproteobacteria bacterium]|nr:SDR family NAD(P)-dependent oxidoreductase [Deltaproteobacteria bacterium]
MNLNGATALITGANGGLGEAIATHLSKAGAKLVLTGRRKDALEPIAQKLGAKMIIADLAERKDVERIHAEAGDIDVLVANAALPASGLFLDFEPAFLDRALDVNLRAPIVMAQPFAKKMAERKRGHLVFISSISGKVAALGTTLYSGTKFGMRGFALALREELAYSQVGVSTIFPGFIRDAGMFAKTGVKLPAVMGTRSPDDVGRAVVKAITKDIAEIEVAAFEQRLGSFLAGISPGLVGWMQRQGGGHQLATEMASAQKGIR